MQNTEIDRSCNWMRFTAILSGVYLVLFFLLSVYLRTAGLAFASEDDFPRLTMAMGWGLNPFFDPGDGSWLPLYFLIYGSWFIIAGDLLETHWFSPLSVLMITASIVIILVATRMAFISSRILSIARERTWTITGLIFSLSVPILCRMTVSGLSEIPVVFFNSVHILLVVRLVITPGSHIALACLIPLTCLQMLRYEYWLLSPLYWASTLIMLRLAGINLTGKHRILIAGLFFLSVFPLVWMFTNYFRHGDAIQFIRNARESFSINSGLPYWGIIPRISLVCWSVLREGWLIIFFGAIGAWKLFHSTPIRILTIHAAIHWLLLISHAFTASVGTVTFERLILPPLIVTFPLCLAGFLTTLDHVRKTQKVLGIALLSILFTLQFTCVFQRRWGGPIFNEYVTRDMEWLQDQARNHGYDIIIDDPKMFGGTLHAAKVYCGVERIKIAYWWEPGQPPEFGKYLYLSPTPSLHGHTPQRRLFNWYCYSLGRMPP